MSRSFYKAQAFAFGVTYQHADIAGWSLAPESNHLSRAKQSISKLFIWNSLFLLFLSSKSHHFTFAVSTIGSPALSRIPKLALPKKGNNI